MGESFEVFPLTKILLPLEDAFKLRKRTDSNRRTRFRSEMSYMIPHLHNGWQVDQAILGEEDRVVVIRFGHDWDPVCMKMDETLYRISEKVKNFAAIYVVDISDVSTGGLLKVMFVIKHDNDS